MKKFILIFAFIIGMIQMINAQETNVEWKKQTYVTGYLSLNGEYIHNLPIFKDIKGRDIGMNVGEASVLTTIKPLEKLKINSVVTYKPKLSWAEIITEISGEWKFSEKFTAKAGRFLLPLHPANSQYYAPMNVGIALPMFVTNQPMFPLSINGLNINGNISLSNDISIYYNLSGGQYTKYSKKEAGLLGFFGRDGVYMNKNKDKVYEFIQKVESKQNGEYPNYFGGGGKLGLKIGDILKLEGAGFYSQEKLSEKLNDTTFYETDMEWLNYGINLTLNSNNLHIKAATWFGNETPNDTEHFDTYNFIFYYGEIAYTINTITPYSKIEIVKGRLKDWQRFTLGINYRPIFETTFKIEYHRYFQEYIDDFNIFQIAIIYSF